MIHRWARPTILALATLTTCTLLLVPLPDDLRGESRKSLYDFSHFVLFAAMTWLMWWGTRYHILTSCALTTALNGLCETAQALTTRSANVPDFFRGLLGSLAMVVLIWAFCDRRRFSALLGVATLLEKGWRIE